MAADGRLSPWYSTPRLVLRMPTLRLNKLPDETDEEGVRRLLARMRQLLDTKQLLPGTTRAFVNLGAYEGVELSRQAAVVGLATRLMPNLEELELGGVDCRCPLSDLLRLTRLRKLDVRMHSDDGDDDGDGDGDGGGDGDGDDDDHQCPAFRWGWGRGNLGVVEWPLTAPRAGTTSRKENWAATKVFQPKHCIPLQQIPPGST